MGNPLRLVNGKPATCRVATLLLTNQTDKMKLHNRVNRDELKQRLQEEPFKRITLSFYQYANIGNARLFRDHFYLLLEPLGVLGRIYVSTEGVNGQVSVPEPRYQTFKEAMNTIVFLRGIRHNIAIEDDGKSFFKLNIKVRDKIVADGLDDSTFDVTNKGKHLSAEAFNKLTEEADTLVVDMRNHYESEVGHFEGAITPDVETFREALTVVEELLQEHKDKHIVMYCTGGIRCEKASAYYKHKGFEKVYQLDGGIIEYARQVASKGLTNKYRGKNFVFDDRLGESISNEVIARCHQCGKPCDTHVNCANDACHILFIQCPECASEYEQTCSKKCADFLKLPEEQRQELRKTMEFNGTKFGKGRYKASHKDEGLDLS